MGYTHYYYMIEEYRKTDFENLVKDFKKILPDLKTEIAKNYDDYKPQQTQNSSILEFNEDGSIKDKVEKTKKTKNEFQVLANGNGKEGTKPIINSNEIRFNGVGEQSHETFCIERSADKNGRFKYFEFTKTARKPYDLAVCAVLIIAKHYLKDAISVHSDGSIDDEWIKPKQFVQDHLGYGKDFELDKDED